MPLISIITPIYMPDAGMLEQAYTSLSSQELPARWCFEWLVQEDGRTRIAEEILPVADGRIVHGNDRHGGVAISRNLALSKARGELVKNLDQDDVLTPGVLARDIANVTGNEAVGWSTSRALDLMPDGTTVGFDKEPPHGILEPGVVLDHWRRNSFRAPVHPTTICIRRDLALALGGWMAVPGSDDTGLLIAASVVAAGYFDSEVGLLYRKWPGQVSASDAHTLPVAWHTRMNLISERADAMAKLLGRTSL